MADSTRNIVPLLPTGVVYDQPVADAVGVSDTVSIAWVQDRAGDTVTATDSFTRVSVSARAVADSVALADARVFAQGESVADTVALADSETAAKTIPKSVTDSITLSDSAVTSITKTAAPADTVSLSDSFSSLVAHGQNSADSVVLADARVHDRGIKVTDSIVLADSPSTSSLVGLVANPTDSVQVTDAVVLDWVADRGFNDDTIGVSDSTTPLKTGGANQSDSLGVADSFSHAATFARSVSDVIAGLPYGEGDYGEGGYGAGAGLVDAQTFAYGKSIADSVVVADSAATSKTGSGALSVDDLVVAITDQFTHALVMARAVSDSVVLTDAVSVILGHPSSVADTVALTDALTRAIGLAVVDNVVPSDNLASAIPRVLSFADQVDLLDNQVAGAFILALLDAVYTGHIGMGTNGDNGNPDRGEISDTVAGVIEEEVTV